MVRQELVSKVLLIYVGSLTLRTSNPRAAGGRICQSLKLTDSKLESRYRERQRNRVLMQSLKVLNPAFSEAVSFLGLPNYIGQYLSLFTNASLNRSLPQSERQI